ncbi:MAG: BON domain-containing protein, partial [Chitinivibrionales bacterium]|nr:BON domain-containing protein [Chitinivibrionales bacterium]
MKQKIMILGFLVLLGSSISYADTVVSAIADSTITRAVESDLKWDNAVSSHLIDITTKKGIVIMSGYVDNLLSRDRAERIAETIKGVRGVVNRIKIRPIDRTDSEIKSSLLSAIALDPALKEQDISVKVRKGRVVLKGTVGSRSQMLLALKVAKGVSGIVEIENEILIQPQKERSDDDIRADIVRRIEIDPALQEEHYKVKVHNGNVSLSGAAGSIPEIKAIMNKANVNGVRGMDTSGLEVKEWADDWLRRQEKLSLSDK